MTVYKFLKAALGFAEHSDTQQDGFGQSTMDDLRFQRPFRTLKKQQTVWRRPTSDEEQFYDQHPLFGRFADDTCAIAQIGDETWIVRERIWHGWPDPERYAFFAFAGDEIRCAADFDYWPRVWTTVPAEAAESSLP